MCSLNECQHICSGIEIAPQSNFKILSSKEKTVSIHTHIPSLPSVLNQFLNLF